LHQVDLPWLSDSKARAAIPYALEEQLAQKLPSLHFAFDREHHQHNRYLVAVIDKVWLALLISRLDDAGIDFHEVTVDWFALHPGEICVTPTTVLMDIERYQGALSFDVARTYLNTLTDAAPVLTFTDSSSDISPAATTPVDSPFLLWVAQRLQQTARMNLCQGEFRRGSQQEGFSRRWAFICAILAGAWLLTVLSVNTINLIRLNHQNRLLDQDIAVVYRQFFPDAQQIISPKFRISQLLSTGRMTQGTTVLWLLLDKLDKVISVSETNVDGLTYRNKALSVALKGRDFKVLESLGERLKQSNVKVTQTQAMSHEHDVTAVMELRL
jgi:general secretion pathway protein L